MPTVKNAQIRFRIIDRCIRNQYKPFPTKEDLRQACEENLFGSSHGEHISDSTIEKDLFAMRMDHDAPIKYSKREKGYYYEDPNFSLENIPLSEDDVDAIKFAANIFDQFKGVPVFKQFEYAIDKILDRVNISQNIEDEAVNKYVQFESGVSMGGSEYLQPILEGIKEKRIITFDYQSFKSSKSKIRRVHPYLLKEYRNRWYVIGFSEDKGDIITYALDRIKDLQLTEDYFIEEKDFNSDDYFSYAMGITSGKGEPSLIRIEANEVLSKYLKSQPLHQSQTVLKEKKSGNVIFTYKLHITPELTMQLLSYGSEVKVLEPKSLVKKMTASAKEMLKLYK